MFVCGCDGDSTALAAGAAEGVLALTEHAAVVSLLLALQVSQ